MSDNSPTYIWEQINKYYQATRKPIHVAVAYTADAAAASLTLASLLKASLIAYDIQPIATTEELKEMIASANLAQEYARMSETDPFVDEFFLLVGLGSAFALTDYFDVLTRHIVVVLDSYRPVHLSNLRGQDGERVMLWGGEQLREEVDGFFREQRQASARQRRRRRRRHAMRRRQRLRRQYAEPNGRTGAEDDDNTQADSEGDQRSDANAYSEEDSDLDDEDEDDDDDASISVSQSQERMDWTDPESVPPYLETAYYACERAGRSCALEAHDLAVLLSRFKDATLWHAAVGVCDLFNRRLIDYATYLVEMRPLHDAVTQQKSLRRSGGNGGVGAAAARLYDDAAVVGDEDDADGDGLTSSSSYLRKRSSNAMELHNRDEEQLYLLRHTSLWEAIWNHPVTASVLRLHHAEDGEGLLRQLLARCGVSAKMAMQPWREVIPSEKTEALRLVQTELRRICEARAEFLTFPNEIRCVSRTSGFSTEVSTFDVCTLHEALLAAVPPASVTTIEANFSGDSAAAQQLCSERLRRFHREQFWKAHAILDVDASACEFQGAVQEALYLQRAVAVATGALMQPGMLQSTAGLHYVIPSDPTRTTTALETFCTVFRLNALGRRLLLTLTVERGLGRYTHAVRPLLVSCALPKAVREEVDTSFTGFSPIRAGAAAAGVATSGASRVGALNDVALNTLPFAAAAAGSKPNVAAVGAVASAQDALGGSAWTHQPSGGGGGSTMAMTMGGNTEEQAFLVLLLHEGTNGSAMTPISSVGRFIACIHDREEFDTLPQQRYLAYRTAAVVADRASAAHLADAMYLACLSSRWDPQREYLSALAEAQEAQQPDDDDEGDEDGDRDDHVDKTDRNDGDAGGTDDDDDTYDADSDSDEDRYFEKDLRDSQPQNAHSTNRGGGDRTAEDETSQGPITVL